MISTLTKKHHFDTVFDSQKIFRLILDAMSAPLKTVNIKEYADKLAGNRSELLAIAMTLLDNEVSFDTCGDNALSEEIASLTLAKKEQVEHADFIFVFDPADIKSVIENAKCGTLTDPQKSATVIIHDNGKASCRMMFSGPGIDGSAEAEIPQTAKVAMELRNAQDYEYPQGIDLIFISDEGELFAIPRLVKQGEDAYES